MTTTPQSIDEIDLTKIKIVEPIKRDPKRHSQAEIEQSLGKDVVKLTTHEQMRADARALANFEFPIVGRIQAFQAEVAGLIQRWIAAVLSPAEQVVVQDTRQAYADARKRLELARIAAEDFNAKPPTDLDDRQRRKRFDALLDERDDAYAAISPAEQRMLDSRPWANAKLRAHVERYAERERAEIIKLRTEGQRMLSEAEHRASVLDRALDGIRH